MKDFKWLTCIVDAACKLCGGKIRQGSGFYFETTDRKEYCRDCGRAIHKDGFEKAARERNIFMKMLAGL